MKSILHDAFQSSNRTQSLRLLSSLPHPQAPRNLHLRSEKTLASFHPSHPITPHPQSHYPSITETKIYNSTIAKTPVLQQNTRSSIYGPPSGALHVLGEIPHPNLTTITCHSQSSRFGGPLSTFRDMRSLGFEPRPFTYWSVLSACVASQNFEFAFQVHSLVFKNGFFSNGYVSTAMIDLYAKKGSFDDALKVFSECSSENVVCWNSIIACGVRIGENMIALDLFRQMVEAFCVPNGFTFSSVLRACAAAGELDVGRGVHTWVVKCNVEDDVFVGTAIIDLYAKCGDMAAAVKEFSQMPVRNVVSWTAIISGFVQKEDVVSALKFFKEMIRTTAEINKCTLTSVLIACSKSLMAKVTVQIHCWTLKTGLLTDSVVEDALISTYAKTGNILMSEKLFKDIDKTKSPGSWLAMISGLAQNKSSRRAIEIFRKMWREGRKPDEKCTTSILSMVDCIDFGRQIHSYVVKVGSVLGVLVGSALFTMYSKCGNIEDSYDFFRQMLETDRVSWTSMISGLAGHGHEDKALWLFKEMMFEEINPDQMTMSAVLMACCAPEFLMKGKEIHGYVFRFGFGIDTLLGSALVSMYSKCRALVSSRRVFDGIARKDGIIWSSLILGYATNGYNEAALSEFHQMVIGGFEIDHITSSSILGVCAYLSIPGLGGQLHAHAIATGLVFHHAVSSALVTMYSKCGSINDSRKVFDVVENPDLITWTAMIDGYAQHGNGVEALEIFQMMRDAGVKPDSVTLVSVLSACSRCGLVEEAVIHFNCMSSDYGIEPVEHHYACMVDLLGRSGRLNEAVDFICRMPIEPDSLVWSTLLAACRAHGDVELGKLAAEKVLEMEPRDSGTYVSLSNISADLGDWEEVMRIRSSMKRSGMKKEFGWSMV